MVYVTFFHSACRMIWTMSQIKCFHWYVYALMIWTDYNFEVFFPTHIVIGLEKTMMSLYLRIVTMYRKNSLEYIDCQRFVFRFRYYCYNHQQVGRLHEFSLINWLLWNISYCHIILLPYMFISGQPTDILNIITHQLREALLGYYDRKTALTGLQPYLMTQMPCYINAMNIIFFN